MRHYPFFHQQRDNGNLPACIEPVLHKRMFYAPSQSEIARELGVGDDGYAEFEKIIEFFKRHGLKCEHYNPYTSRTSLNIFLETEFSDDVDMLVAFDRMRMHGLRGSPISRFSIVLEYDPETGRVTMHDPAERERTPYASVKELVDAMNPRDDKRLGFYVVR